MKWKRVRRRLRSPFLRMALGLGGWTTGSLSFPMLKRAGRLCGRLMCRSASVRKLIGANMRVAFPEWDEDTLHAVTRSVCRNICLTALETVWFSAKRNRIDSVTVEMSETAHQVFDACRGGQPMMLLTPHLGNWELAAQFGCRLGVNVHAVVHQPKDSPAEAFLNRARQANGLRLIPDTGAVKLMLKALRNGDSIGILIDQNVRPAEGGVFVDLFGLPVTCSRAPAMLCRKLKVEAVSFACVRHASGFLLDAKRLQQPIEAYESDQALTRELIAIQEQWIRQYPEQYMWFYKRWRYIPAGLPEQVQRRYPYYARRV